MRRIGPVLLLSLTACAGPRSPAKRVVIVTLDTTRADYISAYGSTHVSTPNVDALARRAALFEKASTLAPLTLTAHSSLFTGLLPPQHGVRDNAADPLASEHTTLAEVLQRRGFHTGAFVGSAVLQASRGLARGFDVYRDGVSDGSWSRRFRRPGGEVVADAMQWLAQQGDTPFLLWMHLYDAHAPCDPPEPYRSAYRDDPYAAAVAYADAQVGALLEDLERRHLLAETVVVVAADHGESFGEHGEGGHGLQLYEEVIRVPLIISAPGLRPRHVSTVASLVDVMPTVLDLVGASTPNIDGASLLPELTGGPAATDRIAYSESMYPARFGRSPLRAVRDDRFKLIDAGRPELYDLGRDPSEAHNLASERGAALAGMSRTLARLSASTSVALPTSRAVSAELRERLAALGYVSGTVSK
jgi:arylsulfatase A-like enzyme